ncbi:APC family permease [Streptomyces sp. 8ZJF_21]|uniref:APC family permease n=1 Tax=Streptomyces sp. 8ZJF_21 TaxID=2903141 RepID=UPI001E2CFA8B|nr:APC family permease [Streptomyces sp. 8ZJF_21]MCD9586647.1 APC family permease [Streptomyces sp. 8ZJF_21]
MAEDTARGTPEGPKPTAGLNPNAIGFVDSIAIGLNSTSPAYSLAAVIGPIAAFVGVNVPGVMLASFLPMLLIASAFYYLNRVDPDCGTTFSWVSRILGPTTGWLGGWAVAMTGVMVVGSLAEVGTRFGLLAAGLDGWVANTWVLRSLTVLVILAMSALCVRSTEASARLQNVLTLLQVAGLLVFAAVALYRVHAGTSSLHAVHPSLGWLNPFSAGVAPLTSGLLLGVFTFWGWESAVNLTEETEGAVTAPGLAAIWSTVILLATYVSVAFAVVAYCGPGFLGDHADDEEAVFATLSDQVLGGWSWVVLLAVATSALASTQTTIIPSSRTALSMARRYALPQGFSRIHPRHRTPDVSTWWVTGIAIVWYLVMHWLSDNALADSLTALSLLVAFYYALTGLACAVHHRHLLTTSVRNFLLLGAGPIVGALLLTWLLVESVITMANPANSYSGVSWFGLGPPLVIGIVLGIVGVLLMLWWRGTSRRFWAEPHPLPPALPGTVEADGTSTAEPALVRACAAADTGHRGD